MKIYYRDEDFVVPFDKVLFCQWADELGEMALKINFPSTQGGDAFWRLSLTGKRAEVFLREYTAWLDNRE